MSTETCGITASTHRRRGERACEACKEAAREYMREYRARNKGALVSQHLTRKADLRAKADLAAKYPRDYNALRAAHLRAVLAEASRQERKAS